MDAEELNESPGQTLVRTLAESELADVAVDGAEALVDAALDEGILRDVPILGTVVGLARTGSRISEALFVRKLIRFLVQLDEVPKKDREKLLGRFEGKTRDLEELGENLLMAIDRLDTMGKPAILARFFAAFLREEIDLAAFMRLAKALERFNLAMLPKLKWRYTRTDRVETTEDDLHELALAGLLTVSLEHSGTIGGSAKYRESESGRQFVRIGFGVEPRV